MKKFLIFLMALTLSLTCFACQKTETTVIRVNEVTHSIFYAPFYVAIEKGFFEEEGITIELTNGGGSDTSMSALLSKGCEVALLGPETGIYTQLGGANDQPVIFAQLTKRDGSFLISRKEEPNFKVTDLKDKHVIAGRRGGMPAMALQFVCNNNGLYNGTNLTLNYDIQFNLTTVAFEEGVGDYVTMFEPLASEYQRAKKGYIVASIGEQCGEVPYTCFMARESYFKDNQKTLESFTKAVYKAIKYIEETDVETVSECLIEQFPSTSLQSISDSIASYKRIDAWMRNMSMTTDSFNRLQQIMRNAGELDQNADFAKLVDNSISEKTYKEIFG